MESPAYLGGVTEGMPIQGQYVYSFDMPMNTRITGYTHRIHDPRPLVKDLPVEIIVQAHWKSAGIPLFRGLLSFIEPAFHRVTVQIVINGLAGIRDMPMNTADLGVFPMLPTGDLYAHIQDTSFNPSRHDWIFYPVWNYGFAGAEKPFFTRMAFQNGAGLLSGSYLTPHLKVDAVLRRFFTGLGYGFQNNVLVSKELSWLTLLNNCSINAPTENDFGSFATEYPLNRSLPSAAANEWLRHLVRRLGGVLLVNAFENTVILEKWSSVRNPNRVHNWTNKAVNPQETRIERMGTDAITHIEDALFPSILPKDTYQAAFFREGTAPPVPSAPNLTQGVFAMNNRSYFWQETISRGDFNRKLIHRTLLGGLGGDYRYETALPTEKAGDAMYQSPYNQALMTQVPVDAVNAWDDPIPTERHLMPSVVLKGNTPHTQAKDWSENQNILLFFRGMQDFQGNPYPLATCERIGFDGLPISIGSTVPLTAPNEYDFAPYPAQHQSDWRNGDSTLENDLKDNLAFVMGCPKAITRHFHLSLKDIRQFSFVDGIYCDNILYIVAKLSFTLSKRKGMSVAEATLLPNR
jgi:hypothetical protein